MESISNACLRGHMKKLKTIDLRLNYFSTEKLHHLFLAITEGKCVYIQDLKLSGSHLDMASTIILENSFKSGNLKHLRHLSISSYVFHKFNIFLSIVKSLNSCPQLEFLSISTSYYHMNQETIQALFELNLPNLKHVIIHTVGILDKLHDFKYFLSMLKRIKSNLNISILELSYKKTCKTVIKLFSKFLEEGNMKSLRKITFFNARTLRVDTFESIESILKKRND